jgi:hypothetical protein
MLVFPSPLDKGIKVTKTGMLITSVAIFVVTAAAGAEAPRARPSSYPAFASSQKDPRLGAFDWSVSNSVGQPSSRRYHGGPKSND